MKLTRKSAVLGLVAGLTGAAALLGAASAQAVPVDGTHLVGYQAHVQDIGWQAPVYDGAVAGTVGLGKRLEAFQASLNPTQVPGARICYAAHVSYIGWQPTHCDGYMAGTTGQSLAIEALTVFLDNAPGWQVCTQAQSAYIGWQPEQCGTSTTVGTTGRGLQMEAVRVRLRPAPVTVGALAPNPISWTSFSGPCSVVNGQQICPFRNLADGDDISMTASNGSYLQPWQTVITLAKGPNVTWWKEVRAVRNDGSIAGAITADTGSQSMTIDTRTTAALVFSKAKFLGVHTAVYDLRGLSTMGGAYVNLTWLKD